MPEQHWHPFFIQKSQNRKVLRVWSSQGCLNLAYAVCVWQAMTNKVMAYIWNVVSKWQDRATWGDRTPMDVVRDLFPKKHYRNKWERFFLHQAAKAMREAARGQ